jgi:proteasome lid subunit RPN8/RPN11
MSFRLLLPAQLLREMVAQAWAELPNECCGILGGRVAEGVARVEARYPLVNAAASPVEYLSDPRALFEADRDMRRRGLQEVAVYHSHPTSDPVPSRKDLAENFRGSTVVHLIISFKRSVPEVRAWILEETTFREAEWEVVGDEP